jgi:hypothetical protein
MHLLNVVSAGAGAEGDARAEAVEAVEAARSIAAEAKVNRLVAGVGAAAEVVLHSVAAVVVALLSVPAVQAALRSIEAVVLARHSVAAVVALLSIAAVVKFALSVRPKCLEDHPNRLTVHPMSVVGARWVLRLRSKPLGASKVRSSGHQIRR